MFFKPAKKSKRGFTILEVLIASGIFGIVGASVMSVYLYSTRSFAIIANYAQLDQINRNAMDQLTREIRASRTISNLSSNGTQITGISLINNDGVSVTYNFDLGARKLRRVTSDGKPSQVLVSDCRLLQFDVRQRTGIGGSWDEYPIAGDADSVQVIRLTWAARRTIVAAEIGISENIQTACVVIRNQHFAKNNHN